MGNNNINLQRAKSSKDDEFYTTYDTIQKELEHYVQHFQDKIVLCNCDNPFKSNFCKFFLRNFNRFKLKRLICTSYTATDITNTWFFDENNESLFFNQGYILDISNVDDKDEELSDAYIKEHFLNLNYIKKLKGNGDFRSKECISYMKIADIVVTNPPFSLFKELVSYLVRYNKNYLLIGNQNALTYKEIFPLIKNNLAWTGYHFGEMKFRVPNDTEPRKTRYWEDETGQKWRSLGNAMWLTNLDNERRHKKLELTKTYNPIEHPNYDNYDAINVKTVKDIPYDYNGVMGVPITIINKYNKDQFEIIGEANHGSDNEYDLFKPTINGKELFKRILIRNKTVGLLV